MQITFSITCSKNPQKGINLAMSDWINEEASRLKDALGAKRIKDEKFVQEHQIKVNQGTAFWQATREEAKRLINELNEKLGKNLLLWRSSQTNEIDVAAPEISKNHSLRAVFKPNDFCVKCAVPSQQQREYELRLFVENGELFWNDGRQNITALQAAERIVSSLTKSIS
jgi:hypothetical protein